MKVSSSCSLRLLILITVKLLGHVSFSNLKLIDKLCDKTHDPDLTCAPEVKQRGRRAQGLGKRGSESLLFFSCQQIYHIPHVLFLTWKNRNMHV